MYEGSYTFPVWNYVSNSYYDYTNTSYTVFFILDDSTLFNVGKHVPNPQSSETVITYNRV